MQSMKNHAARLAAVSRSHAARLGAGVLTLSPMLAMAEADPGIAAFATLTTKVVTYGGLAFGLAVIGTGIWIGIDLFKKGAKKGAK